jgi:threonine dehydrogenase-like Zn-dependent dehydrogenase
MNAVRVSDPGIVEVVELPEPQPADDEQLVSVEAAAMCATDRKLTTRGADPPRVPGHEVVGRLPDGALVGVHPDIGCGECGFCRAGFENRCPDRASIGLERDGGFAERLAAPRSHLVPLEVDPRLGPLLEPLACCVHAVEMLEVRQDDLAMVVGAGPMGMLTMWTLEAYGAQVVVVQRSHGRRRLAAELGAKAAIGPDDNLEEHLGDRPRVAVVTAPGSSGLAVALDGVAVGGIVHAFAGTPGDAPIDANVVHYRHLSLIGSTGSTVSDYERAQTLVSDGRVPLDRLPTQTITLDELPEALRGEAASDALKVLIDISGR